MAVRNQRANCPATSQYIVAAMFFMRTMVGDRLNQINMPRLDAYSMRIMPAPRVAIGRIGLMRPLASGFAWRLRRVGVRCGCRSLGLVVPGQI